MGQHTVCTERRRRGWRSSTHAHCPCTQRAPRASHLPSEGVHVSVSSLWTRAVSEATLKSANVLHLNGYAPDSVGSTCNHVALIATIVCEPRCTNAIKLLTWVEKLRNTK